MHPEELINVCTNNKSDFNSFSEFNYGKEMYFGADKHVKGKPISYL